MDRKFGDFNKFSRALTVYNNGKLEKYDPKVGGNRLWQGTKFSSVSGAHAEGLWGAMRGDIMKENIDKQNKKMGKGYLRVAVMNDDGTEPIDTLVNENGMVFATENGILNYVDEGYLEQIRMKREQQDAYVERLLEHALTDDEEASRTCALPITDFLAIASAGGGDELGLPPECAKYNAKPSFLDYLAPNDPLYYGGIAKLRSIIKSRMPIIKPKSQTGTTSEYINSNKE